MFSSCRKTTSHRVCLQVDICGVCRDQNRPENRGLGPGRGGCRQSRVCRHPPQTKAFWARAREAASPLLTRVGLDSWFGVGEASGIDELSEANHPVRFLESSADLRLSDPGLPPDPTARILDFDPAPVTSEADLSPVGSGSAAPDPSSRAPAPQIESASRLNPTLDGDGAHWAAPTDLPEGPEATPWVDERDRVPVATASGTGGPV